MKTSDLLIPIYHHADEAIEKMRTFAQGSHFNIKHLPDLNRKLSGLNRQQMIVFGARTSECKTSFALQCAYEWSFHHKVLYLSMEMTRDEALTRLYSYITETPNVDVFSGKHQDFQVERFKKRLKTQLIFSEHYGKNIKEIEIVIKDKLSHDKPDILIIDYLQCIKTSGNRRDDIDNYIREMRKLAITKDMLVIICSQVSRSGLKENGEPKMEGLKESGFVEEHADKVLIFWYECKRNPTKDQSDFKVIISKNKMGMTGYVDIKYKPEIYKFYEEIEEKQEEMPINTPKNYQDVEQEVVWQD